MPRFRSRTSWVLASWLLLQFVGVGAPLLFAAKTAIEEVCFCPDAEPGAACPMHQSKKSEPEGTRALKDACAPTDVALLATIGGSGIMPETFVLQSSDAVSAYVAQPVSAPTSFVVLEDSPPPRA